MVAGLSAWHEQHVQAAEALTGVTILPAHVLVESYSVLTRLPAGLAVPAPVAADVLASRFNDGVLRLPDIERDALLSTLAAAGVFGGASYDGLVALEARAHGHELFTLDKRAQETYQRLGVRFQVV